MDDEFTNEDFIDFIESYKDKVYIDEFQETHKCYDTVTELSRSDTDRADPLIINSQMMYGLDWIVKSSKLNEKPPKSTDAIFFREDDEGNLCLHIIEFKFLGKKTQKDKINILWRHIRKKLACEQFKKEDSSSDEESVESVDECEIEECFDENFVNDFKLIRKDFNDPIGVSLKLKPYEVIFITLPKLYEEYCNDTPGVVKKDINSYLNKIDKYYWAFLGNFSQSEYNIKSKTDVYDEYSERLEMTIFKKARIKPWQRFNGILEREILGDFDITAVQEY